MARLISMLGSDLLVDAQSSARMRKLMEAGSWFDGIKDVYPVVWNRGAPISITQAKVGRGPFKAGGEALSEGCIVHESAHNADFAVTWQNLKGPPTHPKLKAVANVIEQTIKKFVGP